MTMATPVAVVMAFPSPVAAAIGEKNRFGIGMDYPGAGSFNDGGSGDGSSRSGGRQDGDL